MDFGNIMDEWLRDNPVPDKDAEARERESPGALAERRRRLLRKKPDAVIDLHGLLQDEAWTALNTFFEDSRRQGFDKVLVIHGKGNHSAGEALLKQLSTRFIETCAYAGEHGFGSAAEGGSGATWVILKGEQKTGASVPDR
ncbi:hypothetical protein AGMMS49928_13130 [Spirochaetia bacterium]|nr:hypothetical protein AGMMS49928_13130 [Spirochaetia bacterium]